MNKKYSNQDLRNENNVEKSDQLHCPTRKRKVRGIFLLLNFPSTIWSLHVFFLGVRLHIRITIIKHSLKKML